MGVNYKTYFNQICLRYLYNIIFWNNGMKVWDVWDVWDRYKHVLTSSMPDDVQQYLAPHNTMGTPISRGNISTDLLLSI